MDNILQPEEGSCCTALWLAILRSASWTWHKLRDVFRVRAAAAASDDDDDDVRLSVEESEPGWSSVRPIYTNYGTYDP